MASALDGPSAWRRSRIWGFGDSGRCSPSAPLDQAPGRSFLALLAGGRGADWRWPGDQLRFTFLLQAEDVEKALALMHALSAEVH